MKKDIIEYYPNGHKNHEITYYPNGNKLYEQFYDEKGRDHRDPGLPDYQQWYENGTHYKITYYAHGFKHNICNPNYIYFFKNGKILDKDYALNKHSYSKLIWMNLIKNI